MTTNFSPTLLNEARFGSTSRLWEFSNGHPRRFETAPLLNFDSLGPPATGTNANRSIYMPQASPSWTWTLNDKVTWIKGDHTFKSGIDIRWHISDLGWGSRYRNPVARTATAGNPPIIPDIAGLAGFDENRAAQLINDVTMRRMGSFPTQFRMVSPVFRARGVSVARERLCWGSCPAVVASCTGLI